MSTKRSAPMPKKGSHNNSQSYSPASRSENNDPAVKSNTALSSGGLNRICPGDDPEKGSNDLA